MNSKNGKVQRLLEILSEIQAGTVTDQQCSELDYLLKDNSQLQDYYILYVSMCAELETRKSQGELAEFSETMFTESQDCDSLNNENSNSILLEMLEYEKNAPAIESPKEEHPRELIQKVVYPPFEARKMNKFGLFVLTASAAAILMFVLFVKLVPDGSYSVDVATLTDQINVKWVDSSIHPKNGDRLRTNQIPFYLDKGIVKLKYDNGVDVVIEGPAKFAVERSGIYFEYGRLFSLVPQSGLGFVVETPTSRFIDMGTEFGVQAEVNGSTELHVIKGKVQLFAGSGGKAKFSHTLTDNKAIRYNANTEKTAVVPVGTETFVRSINSNSNMVWRGQKAFDLADIVGGGNGLGTGRILNSIDPETGKMAQWNIKECKDRIGEEGFVPVKGSEFIDGVFVPDGRKGPVQVTSLGSRWDGPDTSSFFKYNIANSLRIPVNLDEFRDYSGSTPKEDMILAKASKESTLLRPLGLMASSTSPELSDSSIFMHANAGITFDLDRIRRQLPNIRISSFKSTFGIGEITGESANLDLWILIDGQQKFSRQNVTAEMMMDINITLNDKDRFLSLVVTDGNSRAFFYDWGLFMNPRLEVE